MTTENLFLMHTVIKLSTTQMSCDIDNDRIILETGTGQYFNLNTTGKTICELLKQPLSVQQLTQYLSTNFTVSQEQCLAEVIPFLKSLYEAKLIDIVPSEQ